MVMKRKAVAVTVRSTAGLREVLFEELDSLRSGTSTVQHANAVAKLGSSILGTMQIEIDVFKLSAKGARIPNREGKQALPALGG